MSVQFKSYRVVVCLYRLLVYFASAWRKHDIIPYSLVMAVFGALNGPAFIVTAAMLML